MPWFGGPHLREAPRHALVWGPLLWEVPRQALVGGPLLREAPRHTLVCLGPPLQGGYVKRGEQNTIKKKLSLCTSDVEHQQTCCSDKNQFLGAPSTIHFQLYATESIT